jgi:Carboxypeptidase regulatory-like domain/TonB-dependent Receptor Plug Domain
MLSKSVSSPVARTGLLHSVMVVYALLAFMLGTAICVNAQTLSGSIVGTITDPSGAAVVGATVRVTELQTNTTRSVETNERGLYTLSTLPPGVYKLTLSKAGFGGYTNPSVEVASNTVARVDAELKVGDVNEQIEVRTDTTLLQTDRADVHTQLSSTTFQNAPQATRTYQGVLNLVPGMVPPGGQLAGGTNNPSKSMQFAANGTGTQGPNVRIEGVSATNPWVQQYTTFVPSTEAIESVNVVTNSPDAEQGLSGGPAVTVQLKSGTNQMHGSLYEQNVNNFTEARNFFQRVGPEAYSPGG